MKRRIFVAVSLSQETQNVILAWEAAWQARHRPLPVRWLTGENLHITLIPPWYEDAIDDVKKELRVVSGKRASFPVVFERASLGPDPRLPRLIWAEGRVPQELGVLKAELEQALSIPSESRPFRLHLTLARFRPEQLSSFPIRAMSERIRWSEVVQSFVLMESHLSPGGAEYEALEEFGV